MTDKQLTYNKEINKVLSEQIKRGLRYKKTNLDRSIEEAVEKDKF